jgi:hypothetical protein
VGGVVDLKQKALGNKDCSKAERWCREDKRSCAYRVFQGPSFHRLDDKECERRSQDPKNSVYSPTRTPAPLHDLPCAVFGARDFHISV